MIYRCEECGDDFLTEADSYVVKQTHSGVNLYCSCQIKNKENAMSEWITDRRPIHEDDGTMVYGPDGNICYWTSIKIGDAWKPIPPCDPYVKPKRFTAKWYNDARCWAIFDGDYIALRMFQFDMESDDGYREAAERIAAIYEEVMP